jgi:hypothetical protein
MKPSISIHKKSILKKKKTYSGLIFSLLSGIMKALGGSWALRMIAQEEKGHLLIMGGFLPGVVAM